MRARKLLLNFVLPLLLIVCFKGCIYRTLVSYRELRASDVHYTIKNTLLKAAIDKQIAEKDPRDAAGAIDLALQITAGRLSFHSTRTSNDPNVSCSAGRAHCVGYSAFFSSTFNYIAQRQGISARSEHLVGKLSLLGFDLHRLFSSPFWADHDYNRIYDRASGTKLYTDPSLYDYTGITYIRPAD